MQNENNQLIRYGILAVVAYVILQYTWQWVLGGMALLGIYFLLVEHGRNRRR